MAHEYTSELPGHGIVWTREEFISAREDGVFDSSFSYGPGAWKPASDGRETTKSWKRASSIELDDKTDSVIFYPNQPK